MELLRKIEEYIKKHFVIRNIFIKPELSAVERWNIWSSVHSRLAWFVAGVMVVSFAVLTVPVIDNIPTLVGEILGQDGTIKIQEGQVYFNGEQPREITLDDGTKIIINTQLEGRYGYERSAIESGADIFVGPDYFAFVHDWYSERADRQGVTWFQAGHLEDLHLSEETADLMMETNAWQIMRGLLPLFILFGFYALAWIIFAVSSLGVIVGVGITWIVARLYKKKPTWGMVLTGFMRSYMFSLSLSLFISVFFGMGLFGTLLLVSVITAGFNVKSLS